MGVRAGDASKGGDRKHVRVGGKLGAERTARGVDDETSLASYKLTLSRIHKQEGATSVLLRNTNDGEIQQVASESRRVGDVWH